VLQGLLPFLCERFDVHVFARSYRGPARSGRWTVHPNAVYGDVWGVEQVPVLLQRLEPDLVWIVYDAVFYLVHAEVLAPWPTVLYCPIDGTSPQPESIARLSGLTRLILFTDSARTAVTAAALPGLGLPLLPPTQVIPHGLDTDCFRPLAGRRELRQELLGLQDGFVVLNANRNNRRKRPDLTIAGFALFARRHRGPVLCLHMDPRADDDLVAQVTAAGLAGRVVYSDAELGPERLNQLYNACDVGVNTSSGEGWGLVAFEHAATGAPQVVPRHSACAELWSEAGVFLEPVAKTRAPGALCEWQEVSAEGLAEALERLYTDPARRAERAHAARTLATSSRYAWKTVAAAWLDLFGELAR
jgi:glycosyltransferase involved in cell wall biosynthesis